MDVDLVKSLRKEVVVNLSDGLALDVLAMESNVSPGVLDVVHEVVLLLQGFEMCGIHRAVLEKLHRNFRNLGDIVLDMNDLLGEVV